MKIMILTRFFPPSTGGIETFTYNLAKELAKTEEVIVATNGRANKQDQKESFKVKRMKEMQLSNLSKKNTLNLKKNLGILLEDEKIDIIHSHNLVNSQSAFTKAILEVAKEYNVPLVDHCHDGRYEYLNKDLAKANFTKIVAVSNFIKRRLTKIGHKKDKIKVIYNGSDSELFNPSKHEKKKAIKKFKLPTDKKILLFPSRAIRTTTGKFGAQKNFITLYKAAVEAAKEYKNFTLVFPLKVGARTNKKQREKTIKNLEEMAKKDGIRENIKWLTKSATLKDMPALYKAADITCTPSLNEAFGLVFIESMLMETPTIGAKSGAVPEVITHGKTGHLVSPKDHKQLSKILVKLLKNKKLRDRIGSIARKEVIKNFDNRKKIEEIKEMYKRMLGSKKIYLARHPETIRNKKNQLTGWEETPYSKKGKIQFNKIINFLKEKDFDRIISSDLKRCKKMAKKLSELTGKPVKLSKNLRERNFRETKPKNSFETEEEFEKRVAKLLKIEKIEETVIIGHSGSIPIIARNILKNKISLNFPRNTIFEIEINKKGNKLKEVEL